MTVWNQSPVGFEQETNCFQFYTTANLDKTSLTFQRREGASGRKEGRKFDNDKLDNVPPLLKQIRASVGLTQSEEQATTTLNWNPKAVHHLIASLIQTKGLMIMNIHITEV